MEKKARLHTVKTALDDLPYGAPDAPDASGRVGRVAIPQGVSKKRVFRDALLIAWPSFLELVLTQLTSMVDQMMVGRLPGQEGVMALSAVGLAGMPKMLLMTLITALNVGTTAMIARCRGQNNQEKANQVFRQSLVLNFVLAIGLMCLGLFANEWLIRFMSGDGIAPETLAQGVEYLKIQLLGFLPLGLTFTITAALRGAGDTRTPMIYNTLANVINLVFNYIFIYGHFGCPALGVTGASIATVLAQTVAFIIALTVALQGRHYVRIDFKERLSLDRSVIRSVTTIGLPAMMEQLYMRGGLMIFLRMVASLGDTLYATHNIVVSIQSLTFMIGQALAAAATTLVGQCLGKRRYDMAVIYLNQIRLLGLYASIVVVAVMMLFNEEMMLLYNSDPEVVRIGAQLLFLIAITQPPQTDQFITAGGLRGAGDTKYTARVYMTATLIVRSIVAYIIIYILKWGIWGAWLAITIDQMVRFAMVYLRYRSGKWKEIARKMDKTAKPAAAKS